MSKQVTVPVFGAKERRFPADGFAQLRYVDLYLKVEPLRRYAAERNAEEAKRANPRRDWEVFLGIDSVPASEPLVHYEDWQLVEVEFYRRPGASFDDQHPCGGAVEVVSLYDEYAGRSCFVPVECLDVERSRAGLEKALAAWWSEKASDRPQRRGA